MFQPRTRIIWLIGLWSGFGLVPSAFAEDWVLPDSGLGMRTAPLLLLTRPEIRADLALDAAHTASVQKTVAELRAKAASLRNQASGPGLIAARREIDLAMQRWLETELNDTQRSRLAQLDLQWEGPAALVSRPVVGETLAITPAQKRSLLTILQTHAKAGPEGDPRWGERALAVLTPDQAHRWKAMLGRPLQIQRATADAGQVTPNAH